MNYLKEFEKSIDKLAENCAPLEALQTVYLEFIAKHLAVIADEMQRTNSDDEITKEDVKLAYNSGYADGMKAQSHHEELCREEQEGQE